MVFIKIKKVFLKLILKSKNLQKKLFSQTLEIYISTKYKNSENTKNQREKTEKMLKFILQQKHQTKIQTKSKNPSQKNLRKR